MGIQIPIIRFVLRDRVLFEKECGESETSRERGVQRDRERDGELERETTERASLRRKLKVTKILLWEKRPLNISSCIM